MTLTFDQLKKMVGKNLKRYSDTNGWSMSNADVTEADIGELINLTYQDELVPLYVNKFPQNFRKTVRANSWIATGTANAGLTGSILTTTSSIFQNSMVGLYAYNDTDKSKSKIIAYTSGTSVTLQASNIASWSSDAISILGQEFSLGGDASNTYTVESVSIKYNTTDTYYRKLTFVEKPRIFERGYEVGYQSSPLGYLTSLNIGGVLTSGIGILPGFQKKITAAIEADVLITPAKLTLSGDIPRLPVDNALVAGATKKGFEMKHDFDKANYWQTQYEILTRRSVSRYTPMKIKPQGGVRPSSRVYGFFTRRF